MRIVEFFKDIYFAKNIFENWTEHAPYWIFIGIQVGFLLAAVGSAVTYWIYGPC